jgi:hypothetical protein
MESRDHEDKASRPAQAKRVCKTHLNQWLSTVTHVCQQPGHKHETISEITNAKRIGGGWHSGSSSRVPAQQV